MHKKSINKKSSLPIAVLVLFLLVAVTYFNILNAPFIMDDIAAIRDNPRIGDPSAIFESPLWFIRPLFIYISYVLGGLEPFAFHIVNLLFHFGTCVFLFLIIRKLFNERYAWFTALLFSVHPLLTESVTWISALPTPQYSFFLLAALYSFIRYKDHGKPVWYILSLVLFVLSDLTSEKAVIFPLILILLELSFSSLKKNWKLIIPFALIACVLGTLLLMHIGPRATSFATEYDVSDQFYNPLIQIPYAVTSYIELIFFPRDLTIYHVKEDVFTQELILRWIVVVGLLVGITVAYKKSKPVFFWLAFYVITLAPTLIPLTIVWMVAERYAYLAAAGVIAAAAYPLSALAGRKTYETAVYAAVAVMVVGLLTRSIMRNTDWQSDTAFWTATARTSPFSASARNNMGNVYSSLGQYQDAVREFKAAITLRPHHADTYHNLGRAYGNLKEYGLAEQQFKTALKFNPRLWQSHISLGSIYLHQKKYAEAEHHLRLALEYGPPDPRIDAALEDIQATKH